MNPDALSHWIACKAYERNALLIADVDERQQEELEQEEWEDERDEENRP